MVFEILTIIWWNTPILGKFDLWWPQFWPGKNMSQIASKELCTSYPTFFSFFATMSGSRISTGGVLKPHARLRVSCSPPKIRLSLHLFRVVKFVFWYSSLPHTHTLTTPELIRAPHAGVFSRTRPAGGIFLSNSWNNRRGGAGEAAIESPEREDSNAHLKFYFKGHV